MAKPRVKAAGGMAATWYVLKKGREAGGYWKLYKRLRSRNACKTCALGMGGQRGGMVNEAGHFPEVCKKSVQAQAGDMAGHIPEAYFVRTSIDQMGRLTSLEFEKLGRLVFPVVARDGDTHYRRVSWHEAYELAAAAFAEAVPAETFFYSSGRSSNEAAFLLQLVARAYGTPNIHNCSYYCHQASGVALNGIYGSGTGSITLEDISLADVVVLAGANPASNHPRLITQLANLKRRGGKVIVVNPLKELGLTRFRIPSQVRSMFFGSSVSDIYLQPHVGGDAALFMAILKGLIEAGAVDQHFIDQATDGWEALRASIEAQPWLDLLDDSILHRGPDGQGRFRDRAVRPDGTVVDVAFVHRRLSIIDHAGGHQPMVHDAQRLRPDLTYARGETPRLAVRCFHDGFGDWAPRCALRLVDGACRFAR